MPRVWWDYLTWVCLLSAGLPFWHAWRATRATSLRYVVLWLVAAWLAWQVTAAFLPMQNTLVPQMRSYERLEGAADSVRWLDILPFRYLALCLTVSAFVALLGAREPGAAAWNFVIVALLGVLSLPLLEQRWDAKWQLDTPRTLFVGILLLMGMFNYLPTRLLPVVALTCAAVAFQFVLPSNHYLAKITPHSCALVFAASVWFGWMLSKIQSTATLDALWCTFHDRYGLVWGMRVEDQFNAAARHAGYEQRLTWGGLSRNPPATEERQHELLDLLRAALKRFGMGQETPP